MTKKLLSLMVALLLCLTAAVAAAEEIALELLTMDDGLTFAAPSDWTYMELDEDDYEEGYVMMATDEATARSMVVMVQEMDADVTNADLAQAFAEDSDYAGASLKTNDAGMEMVLYALADETMVGYCFVDGQGWMYNFAFLNAEDEKISGDTALLSMVETCMANTGYEAVAETEESDDEEAGEVATAGSIELELFSMDDSLVFAMPAHWTEVELSESDLEDGHVAMMMDEDNGYVMLVMANEVGEGFTNADLEETLNQDPEYATARLVTNSSDQEMVQYVTADQTVGGYALMGEDGWMYNFIFSMNDGLITEDETLSQLVSDCMNNTYFEN